MLFANSSLGGLPHVSASWPPPQTNSFVSEAVKRVPNRALETKPRSPRSARKTGKNAGGSGGDDDNYYNHEAIAEEAELSVFSKFPGDRRSRSSKDSKRPNWRGDRESNSRLVR